MGTDLKTSWLPKDHITAEFLEQQASLVNGIDSPDFSITVSYESDKIHLVVDPAKVAGAVEVTVVTAVRFDTVSGKFQMKTRKVYAVPAEAESGWTDIIGTTACT